MQIGGDSKWSKWLVDFVNGALSDWGMTSAQSHIPHEWARTERRSPIGSPWHQSDAIGCRWIIKHLHSQCTNPSGGIYRLERWRCMQQNQELFCKLRQSQLIVFCIEIHRDIYLFIFCWVIITEGKWWLLMFGDVLGWLFINVPVPSCLHACVDQRGYVQWDTALYCGDAMVLVMRLECGHRGHHQHLHHQLCEGPVCCVKAKDRDRKERVKEKGVKN